MKSLAAHCPGSHWPDYSGGSLLNLMSSISHALKGPTLPAPRLRSELLDGMGQHRHVVLVLIDGLGDTQLAQLGENSCLRAMQKGTLTSVFPATTSAAITTLMTGQAASQHGLIAWHMLSGSSLAETDEIIAPLPLYVRYPHPSPHTPEQLASQLFVSPPLFTRFDRSACIWQPHYIADSPYSRHHAGDAIRKPYQNIADAFAGVQEDLSTTNSPRFHYLYLPQLDSQMHHHGTGHITVSRLFSQLDAGFAALLQTTAATDTAVIATADHGFTDTPAGNQISLDSDFPDLYQMLALPLSGERRACFCHVRQGKKEAFMHQANRLLGHACHVLDSRLLLEGQAFGPGPVHPQLAARVGDVVLLAKDDWSIRDTLPHEKPLYLPGQHGGISQAEMTVPLIVSLPGRP